MKLFILILALGLSGCAGTLTNAFNNLPTVQACQKVTYVREYGHVTVTLDCTVPPQSSPLLDLPVSP
jgi:hypothetical protein